MGINLKKAVGVSGLLGLSLIFAGCSRDIYTDLKAEDGTIVTVKTKSPSPPVVTLDRQEIGTITCLEIPDKSNLKDPSKITLFCPVNKTIQRIREELDSILSSGEPSIPSLPANSFPIPTNIAVTLQTQNGAKTCTQTSVQDGPSAATSWFNLSCPQ